MSWKKRVLIMEDNVRLALSWKQTFEMYEPCEVLICHDSDEAINYLNKNKFDMVITDLRVENDIGGIGVLSRIDEMGQSAPPVIVVTGERQHSVFRRQADSLVLNGEGVSAATMLEKPFMPSELIATARHIWQR